jgi:hypothetical protein
MGFLLNFGEGGERGTIYVTVESGTFLGLLECGVQGQKAVAFPPQTMHTDEMELFEGISTVCQYGSTHRARHVVCSYTGFANVIEVLGVHQYLFLM